MFALHTSSFLPIESPPPLEPVEFRVHCQENNKAVTRAFISVVSFPLLYFVSFIWELIYCYTRTRTSGHITFTKHPLREKHVGLTERNGARVQARPWEMAPEGPGSQVNLQEVVSGYLVSCIPSTPGGRKRTGCVSQNQWPRSGRT